MEIQQFLKIELRKFYREDFIDHDDFHRAVVLCVAWVVPAFGYVVGVNALSVVHSVDYLTKALEQGISPELWNVVGVLSFSLASFSIVFPRWISLARVARHVLQANFCIGSLMLGLLLGHAAVYASSGLISDWRSWFFLVCHLLFFLQLLWR